MAAHTSSWTVSAPPTSPWMTKALNFDTLDDVREEAGLLAISPSTPRCGSWHRCVR